MVSVDDSGPRTLKTLDKAIDLVYFIERNGPIGVTQMADALDISKGTAHAYVSTLLHRGLVEKNGTQYELSLNLLKIGNQVRKNTRVFEYGTDEAYKLASRAEGQVHLAVESDFQVIYVFRVLGRGSDDVGSTVGDTNDLHASGAGKAILSTFTDAKVERYLDGRELPQYTSNTIVDSNELYTEIEEIRKRGYAVANEEQVLGAGTVGSPVVLADGEVIGAITVSVPATRLRDDHQKLRLGEMVNESSDRITMGAGFDS